MSKRIFGSIKRAVVEHHKLRAASLNLAASENVTSATVRRMVASDFMHRYSEWKDHDIGARWGYGLQHTIFVEKALLELVKGLFETEYCEIRALS